MAAKKISIKSSFDNKVLHEYYSVDIPCINDSIILSNGLIYSIVGKVFDVRDERGDVTILVVRL